MTAKERFLRYITYSTASSEESETSPSTERQLTLGNALKDEMEALGLLPERPAEPWHDYGEPPYVPFVENRKREAEQT